MTNSKPRIFVTRELPSAEGIARLRSRGRRHRLAANTTRHRATR